MTEEICIEKLPTNQTLDGMTRSALKRRFQIGDHRRVPRHLSAFRWAVRAYAND
jgi:hypothetical protein